MAARGCIREVLQRKKSFPFFRRERWREEELAVFVHEPLYCCFCYFIIYYFLLGSSPSLPPSLESTRQRYPSHSRRNRSQNRSRSARRQLWRRQWHRRQRRWIINHHHEREEKRRKEEKTAIPIKIDSPCKWHFPPYARTAHTFLLFLDEQKKLLSSSSFCVCMFSRINSILFHKVCCVLSRVYFTRNSRKNPS